MIFKSVSEILLKNISLNKEQINKIEMYLSILNKWNNTYNLVGSKSYIKILNEHIVECLASAPYFDKKNILDIGSGAGLPAIILAIYHPEKNISIVDSSKKKCAFMEYVRLTLNICNLKIFNKRIQQYNTIDNCYEIITTRAFANIDKTILLSKKLLCPNGKYLLLKSQKYIYEKTQLKYEKIINIYDNRYIIEINFR